MWGSGDATLPNATTCPFDSATRTFTCTSTDSAQEDKTNTVVVTSKSPSGATWSDAAWSTKTTTFTFTFKKDPCEDPTSVTASSDVAVNYTLGSSAVTSTWAAYTAVFPDGATPTCAWTYTATNADLTTASAMTVDLSTRSIVFNSADSSLVPHPLTEKSYTIAITAKTPAGLAITGNPTSNVVVKLLADLTCEPPSTVTQSTTPTGDNSYRFGDSAKTITFDAWTYTTTPPLTTCGLTYAATIPTAHQSVIMFDSATRTLTVNGANGSAAAGEIDILINAVSPNGTKITSTTMTIAVTLVDACEPPTGVVAPTIAAATGKLDNTVQSIKWDAWTSTGPADCVLTYAVEIPTAIKDVVTANVSKRTVDIAKSTDTSLAGEYEIKITAKTPAGLAIAADNTATMKLTLEAGSSATTTIAAVASKVIRNIAVTTSTARVARNLARSVPDSSIT